MSYKSLLFCPDEKAAKVVTQVLSELEFTVEIARETVPTVQKLTDEHFDALVVDCHNEQDASLLFKAARNSTHNHSSLSVAVVEGQTGVAKAFRIGANLVLTKPINIEQSKSTLRVAKGLLRKNENRAAALPTAPPTRAAWAGENSGPTRSQLPATAGVELGTSVSPQNLPDRKPAVAMSAPAWASPEPHIAAASVLSRGFAVEKDRISEPEAADAAVLGSIPPVAKTDSEPTLGTLAAPLQPVAASTAGRGAAAAAAPALEKTRAEMKLAGAAPMVTNEPIVRESAPAFEPAASMPTFSSLDAIATRESRGGKGYLRVASILGVLCTAGYFGWQKFQSFEYLHHNSPAAESQGPAADSSASPAPVPPLAQNASASASNGSDRAPSITLPDVTRTPAIPAPSHASRNSAPQEIEVQEMPIARDMKVPPPTKIEPASPTQPLVVNPGASGEAFREAPLAPPPLVIALPSNSGAALSKLVSSDAPLPQPAPNTVQVSQGVSQGLLMKKVPPIYPPMALQLRKEGVVQLLATISKSGDISNVKVLSGDSMLARAAADAVLRWKYRPYLLNGVPVEIETQISIVFKVPQ
jgi:periplasmic protein TonB